MTLHTNQVPTLILYFFIYKGRNLKAYRATPITKQLRRTPRWPSDAHSAAPAPAQQPSDWKHDNSGDLKTLTDYGCLQVFPTRSRRPPAIEAPKVPKLTFVLCNQKHNQYKSTVSLTANKFLLLIALVPSSFALPLLTIQR